MKLLHLGDLHLGRSLMDYDLIEDQRYMLHEIIGMAKEREVDAILVAGDVYDRAIPSEAAVRLFDAFICELAECGIQAFIISGNHDSDERLNYGSSLLEHSGINIAAKYTGTLYHKTMTDEFGDVNVHLLPFVKASQVRHYLTEEKIESYDDAVRAIIRSAQIDGAARNVIVAHQFVTGSSGSKPETSGSEMVALQNVGTVEEIGYDCFDAFDYAALGHIHHAQRVGREEVRYSGSMLKYSLSEAEDDKSVPMITLGAKGDVTVELLPLKPRRDLRHITGPRAELLKQENIVDAEDYIYVTLTDEEILNDAMGIFQQYYPNTVRIEYRNSHTAEIEQVDLTKVQEARPFDELVKDFYLQMYGTEISDEEMELMNEIAKGAGVIHEAD